MDRNNSIDDSDDDDEEFPPLPSDVETLNYDNRNSSIDLFYCPSPSFPSPPTTSNGSFLISAEPVVTRNYANIRTFTSKQISNPRTPTKVCFATQLKKKNRKAIGSILENVYVNMNQTTLETSIIKQNELTYATLINTTSMIQPSTSADQLNSHVEYQEIRIASSTRENTIGTGRFYENIKTRRAPPLPKETEPSCSIVLSPSPPTDEKTKTDSSHFYINLRIEDDRPPELPSRSNKTIDSPLPPALPPRQSSTDILSEQDSPSPTQPTEETENRSNSNISSEQTDDRLELNMSPNYSDKSDLYRRKLSFPITDQLPPVSNNRQRRTLHSIRRRRLRGSIRGLTNNQVHRGQQSRPSSNISVRHPMVTDDRWRRTLRKRRRQRAIQLRLDGNVSNRPMANNQTVSDHTYNEIKTRPSPTHLGPTGGAVLERAVQFNGALRDRVFSWYRGVNPEQRPSTKFCSQSDNEESDQKYLTTNEDEEEEEEEEFFTHNTFEDFLLRRRPKSSTSTTISGTSTVFSHVEAIPQRTPILKQIPQRTEINVVPSRRFPGVALGLDKTDVDFIHNMLQRTRGENRVWNRITALKEAYIRASSKKLNLPQKVKPTTNDEQTENSKKKKKQAAMKHCLAANKIRAELEKYDELPTRPATRRDEDEDFYDESSSIDPRLKTDGHHRSFPSLFGQTAAQRIFNFVTSIKRRAQTNVQQFQKNLNEIRSRLQHENIENLRVQRHSSFALPPKSIVKDLSRRPTVNNVNFKDERRPVCRTNSHHSAFSVEQRTNLKRSQSISSQNQFEQRNSTRFPLRPPTIEPKGIGQVRSSNFIQHPIERRRTNKS